MTKLAGNFRVEVQRQQVNNFLEHLTAWSDYQIDTAFERCMKECTFFPTLKEVLDRMPERRAPHKLQTCKACEPDGWRLIHTDHDYRVAVRCTHNPEYQPPPFKISVYPRAAKPDTPAPRFAHLVGKGIIYSGGKS